MTPTVVVIACDEPTLLLCHRLRRPNLRAVGVYLKALLSAAIDPEAFFDTYQPALLVYDLEEPIEESLMSLCALQGLPGLAGVPVVLTRDRTMPFPRLDVRGLVGILSRPYDLAAARLVIGNALSLRLDEAA
jgi:hypothetical protein